MMIALYPQAMTLVVDKVQISNLLIDNKKLQAEKIETHWMIQNVNDIKANLTMKKMNLVKWKLTYLYNY